MQTNSPIAGCRQSSLAIKGGKPVRNNWLPYGHQVVDDEDIAAVTAALTSDFLTQGPRIQEFENAVAAHVGVKYAVAIANGTAALHAAYEAAGISAGDEIITTPITFAATSNAALYLGAKPLYADVDPDTGLISAASVEKLLKENRAAGNKKIKAVVAVDYAGQPTDYDTLQALADQYEVSLMIDAAHSLGARYKERAGGFAGIMSTMSFHPVKTITTGEGGIILTNDEKLYDRLLAFRSHGIEKRRERLQKDDGPWYHEMQSLGFNYRMCDIQAALGSSQMVKLPGFIERRLQIAAAYTAALKDSDTYGVTTTGGDRQSAYHLFPILIKGENAGEKRRFVFEALHKENIGVQVHYIPTYQMPYYKEQVLDRDWSALCPGAEDFYKREISLPIFPSMKEQDIADVLEALTKIAGELA
ncbi:MAG: UDP-4-amino-4,6-dideoxy-N-acetyl-beta-L-altrosamine transaminase [Candidatus Melainabacteria bacterium]|nr:UDP-4-amino-4,6-dideoxy-N-acetyl-beta-L-altrosamine transaminase [Candidatus Melainabacteria bacterium]